jgi:hypothetical protein
MLLWHISEFRVKIRSHYSTGIRLQNLQRELFRVICSSKVKVLQQEQYLGMAPNWSIDRRVHSFVMSMRTSCMDVTAALSLPIFLALEIREISIICAWLDRTHEASFLMKDS